jgi:hypothetical protein
MTRGRRPRVAIAEAMAHAGKSGWQVLGICQDGLPCDFLFARNGRITVVRVRRLRNARPGLPGIRRECRLEIEDLRWASLPASLGRELWVRGANRHWCRIRVLPGHSCWSSPPSRLTRRVFQSMRTNRTDSVLTAGAGRQYLSDPGAGEPSRIRSVPVRSERTPPEKDTPCTSSPISPRGSRSGSSSHGSSVTGGG